MVNELINCFLNQCGSHLQFLEQYGFSYLSGLSHINQERSLIFPYDGFCISKEFNSLALCERENIDIHILFHPQQHYIAGYARYNQTAFLEIPVILKAALCPRYQAFNRRGILGKGQMRTHIPLMADIIKANLEHFTDPKPGFINRATRMQHKLIETAQRECKRQRIDQAMKIASKEFAKKNYKMVIELLRGYLDHLSSTERKKYDLAVQYLLHGEESEEQA